MSWHDTHGPLFHATASRILPMPHSVLTPAAAVSIVLLAIACLHSRAIAIAARVDTGDRMPISTIRRMPLDKIALRPAVQVRGVVTQRQAATLIVQDGTGGIYVNFEFAAEEGVWQGEPGGPIEARVGTEIEVDGIVDPGGFSPALMPSAVRLMGPAALPPPRTTDVEHFFSGADDCERVQIEAIVHGVQPVTIAGRRDAAEGTDRVPLSLERDGRLFEVLIHPHALPTPPESLIDATVRVTGPPVALFNTRGEFLIPLMWIDEPENFAVVVPPRAPPFAAPFVPIERLGKFRADPLGNHVFRTVGTVTHATASDFIYLQSDAIGVRVATRARTSVRTGDKVEVAGFLDRSGRVCGIADAEVRVVSHGSPPAPIDVTPDEMERTNSAASGRNLMARPGDFEGCLVRFTAQVVNLQTTPEGGIVVMTAGHSSVIARLPGADMSALASLDPGTQVRITGVGQMGWQSEWTTGRSARPLARPTQVTLLLRSVHDIEVITPAPFWTSRRLFIVTAAIATVLLGSLAWVALLRRQVASQLDIIEDKLRCEAVAGERRRIAREFHDTLEQSLAGVAMQLDAASRRLGNEESRTVIREQRKLIGRLQTEARDFLWDLRDSFGEESDLGTALATQAAALATLSETAIRLDVGAGLPTLAPEVQHDVIRIVREAVLNAFRHAEAKNIDIVSTANLSGREGSRFASVTVAVEDDGCGFDVGARSALPGHYGIRGMIERAERIDAQVTITSSSGHGTKVRIHLPFCKKEGDGVGAKAT
jgi:signal transduction histidine kinase